MKIPVFCLFLTLNLTNLAVSGEAIWKRHTIDASDKSAGKLGADGVRLADANGDGYQDVVTGWENVDAIRVCLHPGPAAAKELWPAVTVGRVKGAEDAVFVDLDGDGALDVVTSTEGKTRTVFVHWAPAEKGRYLEEDAWKTEKVPALEKAQLWMYALPIDANADGKMDLILGSKSGGATVGWLEAPKTNPRDLSQWRYHKFYDAGWIMSIRDEDLDGDGDRDVLFSDRKGNSSGVWWLENVGPGNGECDSVFAAPRQLGCAGKEAMFLDVVDLNDDDRLDVAVAIKRDRIEFLFQPENGPKDIWEEAGSAMGVPQDRFGSAKAVKIADLNLDGQLQMAITCENAKGSLSGCFWSHPHWPGLQERNNRFQDISGPEGVKYDRIELIDLDADGDLDLMTCEERDNLGVFWFENPAR